MPKCSLCGTEDPESFEEPDDTERIHCIDGAADEDDLEDEGDLDYGE